MEYGCCTQIASYCLLEEAGYDYIELSGRAVTAMDEETFRDTVRTVREGSLRCGGFVAYCPPEVVIAGPGYRAGYAMEYAKRCAQRAAALGARTVGIGSPMSRTLPEGFDRETARRQAEEFFAVTCAEFAGYGITVCVEPLGYCFCNFINTLDEGLALVRAVGARNLGMVLDFYNMEQSGEADADISPYLPKTAAIHMSDDAGGPRKRWFLREDKAAVHSRRVRMLAGMGYDKTVSVEIDLPVTLEAAKQSLAILKGDRQTP